MKEPQPLEKFIQLLSNTKEVVAAYQAELGDNSVPVMATAGSGNSAEFLEWFENWRLSGARRGLGDLSCKLVYTMDDSDDTWAIRIYRSGPLYWIRVFSDLDPDDEWRTAAATEEGKFEDIGYFSSEKEAVACGNNIEQSIT